MPSYLVSASPHIRSPRGTAAIMRDVLIALAPAAIAGAIIQGPLRTSGFEAARPLLLLVFAVISAVAAEALMQKAMGRRITISDLSAAVTGLLIGMNLPPTAPMWVAVLGSVFAIVLGKQLFGGLGFNFLNPALAARAFLLASWPAIMTNFPPFPVSAGGVDAFTSATPLVLFKSGALAGAFDGAGEHLAALWRLAIGATGGCIGEGCALLLIAGGVYLMVRRVIDWRIPVTFLVSYALFDRLFGNTAPLDMMMLSGGLMLGSIYMATDYVTSPENPMGHIIFGLGCGLLTALIRVRGGYPEGVSFAILLMNLCVPLINRFSFTRPFGGGKKAHAK
nr:RnfABCDGE type electron transport complex subunit D [bacterium]